MSKKSSKSDGIDRYHELDPTADAGKRLNTIYNEWAESYDDDNDNKLRTVSQPNTVAMLQRHCPNFEAKILDVGCGTGIVGKHLSTAGFKNYDGTDPSPEMLKHAEKQGYTQLFPLDIGKPLATKDDSYDATLCVGVFTHGHVGPEGIDELIRVTKLGGTICFTVNEGVWEASKFPEAIEAFTSNGSWELLEKSKQDYMINEGVQAWYIAARKR